MNTLLSLKNIKKHFPLTSGVIFKKTIGTVKAVDGVSLDIAAGETLGIVGESGCGKSTLGRLIVGLLAPTSGQTLWEGQDIWRFSSAQWKAFRRQVQFVFQDPFSSLNPRMKVKDIVGEPLIIHGLARGRDLQQRVRRLLETVGISSLQAERYPHEFSGGQRQRIGIARALALNPKLIVYDEPVSALDVSIQAQVLNLIMDIQKEFKLTYVFISHDLSVITHCASRIAVMYLGRIVELGNAKVLFSNPQHPYTEALLSACPIPDPALKNRPKIILTGDVPSPLHPPTGCHFHPRCRYAQDSCKTEQPTWIWLDADREHGVLCPIQPFAKMPSAAAIKFEEETPA